MKKYLSFILTICILLGCASLISCNFEGIFGKTSSSTKSTELDASTKPSEQPTQPTESTEPSETEKDPNEEPSDLPEGVIQSTINYAENEITIAHTENFTDDDIEFVKRLNGRNNYYISYDRGRNDLSHTMFVTILANNLSLMYIEVDTDNPYFICGYIDLDLLDDTEKTVLEYGGIDITRFIWYKFSSSEEIPQQIGELDFFFITTFLIFDCTAVDFRDVDNGKKYNCKYALYCTPNKLDKCLENVQKYRLMTYALSQDVFDGTYRVINQDPWDDYVQDFQFKCYVDEKGEKYIILHNMFGHIANGEPVLNDTYAKIYLVNYYNRLISYFVHIPALDFESSDGGITCYYGMLLDDFIEFWNEATN